MPRLLEENDCAEKSRIGLSLPKAKRFFCWLEVPLLPRAMVIVAEKLYVPPRIWMVCPGCTRVMAAVSVVGALIVPGFESVPFGATKISLPVDACGVALAWFELPLSPAEFTAETTKKYVVPLVSPVLVKLVEVTPVAIVVYGPPFVVARLTL